MKGHNYGLLLYVILFVSFGSMAQQTAVLNEGDAKYREDQFYAGVTYNLINSAPEDVKIQGLSGGIQFGFLRDMPINARRNIAVAVGLGVSFDQYGSTLFIGESTEGETVFTSLSNETDVVYDSNRFSTAVIEVPFEFRWRSSTPVDYSFWRVYGGVRVGYALVIVRLISTQTIRSILFSKMPQPPTAPRWTSKV